MIVKRRMIFKESEYKRELTATSRKSYLSVCEFYKCRYRDLESKCIDKEKQQCKECENLNFDGYIRRYSSYFYIHQ